MVKKIALSRKCLEESPETYWKEFVIEKQKEANGSIYLLLLILRYRYGQQSWTRKWTATPPHTSLNEHIYLPGAGCDSPLPGEKFRINEYVQSLTFQMCCAVITDAPVRPLSRLFVIRGATSCRRHETRKVRRHSRNWQEKYNMYGFF